MALKTNRKQELYKSIQTYLLDPDFNLEKVRAELMLVLNDEEFFELMCYRLESANQIVQKNALTIITFIILVDKINVETFQNQEAFELCESLINKYQIKISLEEIKNKL